MLLLNHHLFADPQLRLTVFSACFQPPRVAPNHVLSLKAGMVHGGTAVGARQPRARVSGLDGKHQEREQEAEDNDKSDIFPPSLSLHRRKLTK
jgi:hypothetical protein